MKNQVKTKETEVLCPECWEGDLLELTFESNLVGSLCPECKKFFLPGTVDMTKSPWEVEEIERLRYEESPRRG